VLCFAETDEKQDEGQKAEEGAEEAEEGEAGTERAPLEGVLRLKQRPNVM
jgi:hypothetical protein